MQLKFKRKRCFKVPKERFLNAKCRINYIDGILIVRVRLEWKMGFGFDDQLSNINMSKNPFLLPPEFYKNLFAASAILQKPNQSHNDCSKLFNAQNFPRNLLFSCGDDKEVNSFHDGIMFSFYFLAVRKSPIFLRSPLSRPIFSQFMFY